MQHLQMAMAIATNKQLQLSLQNVKIVGHLINSSAVLRTLNVAVFIIELSFNSDFSLIPFQQRFFAPCSCVLCSTCNAKIPAEQFIVN